MFSVLNCHLCTYDIMIFWVSDNYDMIKVGLCINFRGKHVGSTESGTLLSSGRGFGASGALL